VFNASVRATPGTESEKTAVPRYMKLLAGFSIPQYMMPGLFNFNKINKLVEEAREKAIANIAPIAGFDISRISS
jgi:hypothetical protein